MSIIERATSRMHQDAAARQGRPQDAADAAHAVDAVGAVMAPPAADATSPSASPTRGMHLPSSPAAVLRSRGNGKNIELDAVRMQAMGFITAGTRTPLMEEVRVIKRPLITRAFSAKHRGEKPGNLIMITSSLPGEGKTFAPSTWP